MDAVEFAARDRQVPPCGRTAGQHHGVELRAQLLGGDVDADVHAGAELGADLQPTSSVMRSRKYSALPLIPPMTASG